jgi:hypothetical protein
MSSTPLRKVEDDLIDSALIATLLQLLEQSQEVPNQRQSRKINGEEGQRRLQDLLDCDHNDRKYAPSATFRVLLLRNYTNIMNTPPIMQSYLIELKNNNRSCL